MSDYSKLPPIAVSLGGFAFNGEHIEYWKTQATKADREIASLRAQLAARPAPTRKEIAQTIWIKWRGYNPSNDQLENSTTGREFLAIADAILVLFAQSDEQRT